MHGEQARGAKKSEVRERRRPGRKPTAGAAVLDDAGLGSIVDRDPVRRILGADVFSAGTDEAIVVELFDDVGGPSGDAADGENGRIEVDVDAQRGVGGGGVEIHVGVELFVGLDIELDGAGHLEPFGLAGIFAELFAHAAQVRGAGVFSLVDAMAKAGDFLFRGEHALDVFDRVGTGLVDGIEQAHHALVGAAVQRAFERADGAGNSGVDVGQCSGDDAGGEGGGVELVVGVKDEGDIEGASGGFGRLDAVEHPEKIGGVSEGAVGGNHFEAFAEAVVDGDDHGEQSGKRV